VFEKWKQRRLDRRIDKLTAQSWVLVDNKLYDIVLLYNRGFISVQGVGQNITRVNIEVENLLRKPLIVAVKPGAYFQSTGEHQNMATTRYYQFELPPLGRMTMAVDAACINAALPIPGKVDGFAGVAHVGPNVARFLEASTGMNNLIVQSGVWAITDSLSGYAIKDRLKGRNEDGESVQIIFDHHIEEAKALLDQLGIGHQL
jgi:hypothetical protein